MYSGVDLEVTITLDTVNSHSTRLFCSGVPVSNTRLLVLNAFNAFEIYDPSLRRICPSSHTTKSGPEKKKNQPIIEKKRRGEKKHNSTFYCPCQLNCTWIHQDALQLLLQLFTTNLLGRRQDAVVLVPHDHDSPISVPHTKSCDPLGKRLHCPDF